MYDSKCLVWTRAWTTIFFPKSQKCSPREHRWHPLWDTPKLLGGPGGRWPQATATFWHWPWDLWSHSSYCSLPGNHWNHCVMFSWAQGAWFRSAMNSHFPGWHTVHKNIYGYLMMHGEKWMVQQGCLVFFVRLAFIETSPAIDVRDH